MVASKGSASPKLHPQRPFLKLKVKRPFLKGRIVKGKSVVVEISAAEQTPIVLKVYKDKQDATVMHGGLPIAKIVLNRVQKPMPWHEQALRYLRRIPGEVMAMDYRLGDQDGVADLGKSGLRGPYISDGLPLLKPNKLGPSLVLSGSSPFLFSNRANRSLYELYFPSNGSNYKVEYNMLQQCWIAAHCPHSGWLLLVCKRKHPQVLFYNCPFQISLPDLPRRIQCRIFGYFTSDPCVPNCKILLISHPENSINIYRKEGANLGPWTVDVIPLYGEQRKATFEGFVRARDYFMWAEKTMGGLWWLRGWENIDQAIDFGNRKVGKRLVGSRMISGIQSASIPYLLVINKEYVAQIFRIDVSAVECMRSISHTDNLVIYTVATRSGFCQMASFESQQNMIYVAAWMDLDCC